MKSVATSNIINTITPSTPAKVIWRGRFEVNAEDALMIVYLYTLTIKFDSQHVILKDIE